MGSRTLDRVDVNSDPARHPAAAASEGPPELPPNRDAVTSGQADGCAPYLGGPRRTLDGVHRLTRPTAHRRTARNDEAKGDHMIAAGQLPLNRLSGDLAHQVH